MIISYISFSRSFFFLLLCFCFSPIRLCFFFQIRSKFSLLFFFVICNEYDDDDEKEEGQILLSFDVKLHSSIYRPLVDGSMISLSRCNRFEIDIDTDRKRKKKRKKEVTGKNPDYLKLFAILKQANPA